MRLGWVFLVLGALCIPFVACAEEPTVEIAEGFPPEYGEPLRGKVILSPQRPYFGVTLDFGLEFAADPEVYGAAWKDYFASYEGETAPGSFLFSPDFSFQAGVLEGWYWPSGWSLELEQRFIVHYIAEQPADRFNLDQVYFLRMSMPLRVYGTYRFLRLPMVGGVSLTPFVGLGVGARLFVTIADGPEFGTLGEFAVAPDLTGKAGVELQPGGRLTLPLYLSYTWAPIDAFKPESIPLQLQAEGNAGGFGIHLGLRWML